MTMTEYLAICKVNRAKQVEARKRAPMTCGREATSGLGSYDRAEEYRAEQEIGGWRGNLHARSDGP